MFEDDPPPLPLTPCIETSCNSTFADLSDHNRFTAVADDDCEENNAEIRSHMSVLLHTGSSSEFVKPEMAAPLTESTKVGQTPNHAHDFFMETVVWNNSAEGQNPLSSSSHSLPPHFPQVSEPRDNPEDLHVVECSVMTPSGQIQEDGTTSDGSHDMAASSEKKKDSIPTENAKDVIKDSSDLQITDLTRRNEKTVVVESVVQNDDDDEFGDFEEFVKEEGNQKSESDNWADFKSSSLLGPVINKSAERGTPSGAELAAEILPLPTLLESLDDVHLWAVGNEEEENSDEHDIPDDGVYETLRDAVNTKGHDRPDKMLWMAVSIIEEALALKLQWHDSLIRSCFLQSLSVDVKQTVRNSDLPVFAQQLEENAVLAPVSAVERCAVAVDEKNLCSSNQQTSSGSVTVDSLAVPPVQFDWNTSGLTNPLKTGSLNVSSSLLDLDFLETTSSRDTASDGSSTAQVLSTLQKDLTLLGLNSPDDAEKSKSGKDVSSNTPIVLDYQLLKKNGNEQKCKPVSELSLDARALHDRLPDLDYMLSNVLLFPVVER